MRLQEQINSLAKQIARKITFCNGEIESEIINRENDVLNLTEQTINLEFQVANLEINTL